MVRLLLISTRPGIARGSIHSSFSTKRSLSDQMLARSSLNAAKRISMIQRPLVRAATTTTLSQDESLALLQQQRRRRPNSPHLSIYKPQLTWILSSMNRVTGVALSGGLYLFAGAYLAAPVMGWHLDSATLAEAFGSLNEYAKFSIKAAVAFPFTFHSWNGIRHLMWDTASELSLKGVYRTGWTVVGLTAVSTIALALI